MTDEIQTAEAQAESDFPEAWKPSPGDTITGKFVGVEMIDPNGNGPYPCVTLQTAGGERNVHSFHTALRRSLARRAPKIGDELTITYLGERSGGKFGSYHSYRVSGGQAQEFDWSSQLPPEERGNYQVPSVDPPIQPASTPSQVQPASTPAPSGEHFGDEPPF